MIFIQLGDNTESCLPQLNLNQWTSLTLRFLFRSGSTSTP
jgi:hypothetical protein